MRIANIGAVLFVMWVVFINAAAIVSATDDETISTDEKKVISTGNIVTAPSPCPPLQKRDRRNRCRRVYSRWYSRFMYSMCHNDVNSFIFIRYSATTLIHYVDWTKLITL